MNFKKDILSYIIIVILVIIIRTFLITPARVNGDSMEDTLFDKEIVFVNKFVHYTNKYKRFDIVVVQIGNERLIKRLIGFENETIEYKDNKLFVNDKEVELPLMFEDTEDFKIKVEKNSVFVLGDNRDVSKDSRFFGSFKIKNLRGTVTFRLLPFKKIGSVK